MVRSNGVMLDVGMWARGHSRERPARLTLVSRIVDARIVVDAGIGVSEAHACSCKIRIIARMTRGKQKIEAQKRSAERNEKPKGSQIEARNAGLKTVCSVCKAPLANYKQLVDHFGSKHPKETVPPGPSS